MTCCICGSVIFKCWRIVCGVCTVGGNGVGGSTGVWGCVSIPYGGTCKKISAMKNGAGEPAVASATADLLLHGGDIVHTS